MDAYFHVAQSLETQVGFNNTSGVFRLGVVSIHG